MKRATVKVAAEPDPPPPDPDADPTAVAAGADLEPGPPSTEESKSPKESKDQKLSPTLKKIRDEEEASLRDWLDDVGAEGGAFRVGIRRLEPRSIRNPATGQDIITAGFLTTYEEFVTEERIREEWGGGKYQIKVNRQGPDGSWKIKHHRTITIAGEPRLDRLPQNPPATTSGVAPPPPQENATIAKAAFDLMADQLKRKEDRQPERGIDPAISIIIEQNRETMAGLQRQIAVLQTENAAIRNQKPPEDPFRERMLSTLMDGDSARLTAVRTQHESERNQLREGFAQELRRIEDRHDRTVDAMRQSHEREVASLKQGYEREISAMRSSFETAAVAARTTNEVQATVLKAEVDRLTVTCTELRHEVKDLREKKEKSIIDSIEEVEKLKGLLGAEDGDKSSLDKLVDAATSPTAIEGIGKILGRVPGVAAAMGGSPEGMVPNPAAPALPRRRVILKDPNGQHFEQVGDRLVPVKKKNKVVTTEAGAQIEVPAIDTETIQRVISMLENAYNNKMEPDVVAQSARPHIQPDVLGWVHEHGIDLFMSKVAKLPGTSPLCSQAGKNWLRAVGQVLTGSGE